MESTPEINNGHGQGIQPIEVLFGAIGLTVVPVNSSAIETQQFLPNQILHVHILYLVKNEKKLFGTQKRVFLSLSKQSTQTRKKNFFLFFLVVIR